MLKSSKTFVVSMDVEYRDGKDEKTMTIHEYDGDKYKHIQTIRDKDAQTLYNKLMRYEPSYKEKIKPKGLSEEDALRLLKGSEK